MGKNKNLLNNSPNFNSLYNIFDFHFDKNKIENNYKKGLTR